MREKLESFSIIALRRIAKALGIKMITSYRKADLIERIMEAAEAQGKTWYSVDTGTFIAPPADSVDGSAPSSENKLAAAPKPQVSGTVRTSADGSRADNGVGVNFISVKSTVADKVTPGVAAAKAPAAAAPAAASSAAADTRTTSAAAGTDAAGTGTAAKPAPASTVQTGKREIRHTGTPVIHQGRSSSGLSGAADAASQPRRHHVVQNNRYYHTRYENNPPQTAAEASEIEQEIQRPAAPFASAGAGSLTGKDVPRTDTVPSDYRDPHSSRYWQDSRESSGRTAAAGRSDYAESRYESSGRYGYSDGSGRYASPDNRYEPQSGRYSDTPSGRSSEYSGGYGGQTRYNEPAANAGYGAFSSYGPSRSAQDILSRSPARDSARPSFGTDSFAAQGSSETAHGVLEIMSDGFGFLRPDNYLMGPNDIYVSPAQIRKFNMRTGDIIDGIKRPKAQDERNAALLYVTSINGEKPEDSVSRVDFEDLTPVFPHERIRLERTGGPLSLRIVDLVCPIGKGQRGMIVSPPKAGKTTLLKSIALAVEKNCPDIHLMVLLIDERPEEVTDMRESIAGDNAEVIYSTFDKSPENHRRLAEMVLARAKRMVEQKKDVFILLDSITRLARACNAVSEGTGRTLSGGLDPQALSMPKRFFGAARCMREGGSLTILSTALVETGSRMDDVIFEEFKGTGNMELVLDRRLSERRIFPAIDVTRSSTRREDLLLSPEEQEAVNRMRRSLASLKPEEAMKTALAQFNQAKTNADLVRALAEK